MSTFKTFMPDLTCILSKDCALPQRVTKVCHLSIILLTKVCFLNAFLPSTLTMFLTISPSLRRWRIGCWRQYCRPEEVPFVFILFRGGGAKAAVWISSWRERTLLAAAFKYGPKFIRPRRQLRHWREFELFIFYKRQDCFVVSIFACNMIIINLFTVLDGLKITHALWKQTDIWWCIHAKCEGATWLEVQKVSFFVIKTLHNWNVCHLISRITWYPAQIKTTGCVLTQFYSKKAPEFTYSPLGDLSIWEGRMYGKFLKAAWLSCIQQPHID